MVNLLYNLLLILILPVIVPYHVYRSVSRGRRVALAERFGLVPTEDLERLKGAGGILVHAVSVGETIAVLPLLRGLKAAYPDKRLILSNGTETGRSVALKSGVPDLCVYFPFDYPFAVNLLLGKIRPDLVVIMETEIWPNFMREARRRDIPVLLANGRISDRSFSRYLRFAWLFRPVLEQFTALCMQTGVDAERIRDIGAPAPAVHVTGNLKYDIPVQRATAAAKCELRARYLMPDDALVFCAASTHPGEDELVLDAYQALLTGEGKHFLLLAPRHPERAPAVAELLAKRGIPYRLRSTLSGGERLVAGEALLLDTVGELARLYGASDVVFVGGSLVPTGGHNPLEPASCAVPVLFGPHMENFREIASLFVGQEACLQVTDGDDLCAQLVALAADPERMEELGDRGARILEQNAGAASRHLEVVARSLGPVRPSRGGERG